MVSIVVLAGARRTYHQISPSRGQIDRFLLRSAASITAPGARRSPQGARATEETPMHTARMTRRAALALLGAAGLAQPRRVQAQAASRTLTLAAATNINTLDPHQTATIPTDMSVISHLHAALLIRGPDMSLQPQLATEWRAVDDLTWQFTLREGVTFADGEPLDAAAVKWNFERVLDPQFNARIRSWFTRVREVVVVSPTKIEIRTSEPFAALPGQLSMFFLLPPRWTQANNPANASVGAGPYELREFSSGNRIVLAAREGWFGERPAFDQVVFRVVPETGARIAGVLAGELDFITGVPPSEFQRINASGRAVAAGTDSTRIAMLKYNAQIAPLRDNAALRQALNYAVDRAAIRDAFWGGLGSLSQCQMLTPAYFGFNPELPVVPYDPARARQLLREAGIQPGQLTLELEVPVGPYLLAQEITQAIAAQLEEVGIHTRLVEMDFGAFMDKQVRAHNMGQMSYLTYAWPTLDGDGMLSLFEQGNVYNYWDDAQFTQLVRQARQTVDEGRRMALYRQATQRMCEQAPVLFLFNQPVTYATSSRVRWQARGDDWVRAWDFVVR
jgi:peptide/nickel transport system substrate-binding protein